MSLSPISRDDEQGELEHHVLPLSGCAAWWLDIIVDAFSFLKRQKNKCGVAACLRSGGGGRSSMQSHAVEHVLLSSPCK